jgi:bla regulator protein blaR1
MDFINQFLPENILYALGWTVVHSLWQSFIVALLLSAYFLAWQKTNARIRYLAGNVALATILVAAVVTFFIMLEKMAVEPELASSMVLLDEMITVNIFEDVQAAGFSEYFNQNMPLIVTVWLVGMVFFLLKMVGGLLYLQRLRHRPGSGRKCWAPWPAS